MEGVPPDIDVGQDLIVQLGHSAQELLLYLLLCDVDGVEESDHIAALRILVVLETCLAPKSAAVSPFSKKFKMEVCLTGGKVTQELRPVK